MSGRTIVNRKARFEYAFLDSFEAGIALTGSEVKSLREGNANLTDAYCHFRRGELYVKGLHIAPYKMANAFVSDPLQERKLLLRKLELRKLERKSKDKGFTIIPYKIYFNERGLAKIEIAIAQGKKMHDKRETIRREDTKRELERVRKIK